MNQSELVTAVYDELGADKDDPMFPTSKVLRQLNSALRKLSAEKDWPWLEATQTITVIAGTGNYALSAGAPPAAGFLRSKSLKPPTPGNPLAQYPMTTLDAMFPSTGDLGPPRAYAVDGYTSLVLRPTPDGPSAGAWVHRFVRTEPALIDAQQEPLVPETFQDAIVFLAASRLLGQDRSERLAELVGEYRAALERMRDDRSTVGQPRVRERRVGRFI